MGNKKTLQNEKKPPSVLIIGAKGFLGEKLQKYYPDALCPTHDELDIRKEIKYPNVELVIHCAALKNGPCTKNKTEGMLTNIKGTCNVSEYCSRIGAKLVYISTDYVFRGEKGDYKPTDDVYPMNYYGETKLAGEYVSKSVEDHLIVRLSFFPDVFPYKAAFDDQYTTRITASEAAKRIYHLIEKRASGIHHICGKKQSVYEYALATCGENGVEKISMKDDPLKRPKDTSLKTGRKKIIVAGGEGYLGSVLCHLLHSDHDVTSVDLGWFKTTLPDSVKVERKNLFDIKSLVGYDVVVFAAGLSNDPMSDHNPDKSFSFNAGLPFYLAKLARESGVSRFLHAGSCSVYGFQDEILTEDSETLATTYYGMSKLQGEQSVLKLKDDNFSVASIRMGTLSGWSPRMRFDLIVNTMFKCAKNDKKIYVFDPSVWRPILHVEDAARVYQLAIESNEPWNGVFNAAQGNYQVLEVAEKVSSAIPSEIINQHGKEIRNYRVESSKLLSTGFKFKHNSIENIVNDLNCYTYSNFEDDNYYNIRVFRKI